MSGSYDYLSNNPGTAFNAASVIAPLFGASALGAPLRVAGGVADLSTIDKRNKGYADDRAKAETAISAYKNASDEDKQSGKVPNPTMDQWLLSAGGNAPQSKDAIANRTIGDVGMMGQQAMQQRAIQQQGAQRAASNFAPPAARPMATGMASQMFKPPGQQPGSAEMVAKLLAMLKQQQQPATNPWKIGGA